MKSNLRLSFLVIINLLFIFNNSVKAENFVDSFLTNLSCDSNDQLIKKNNDYTICKKSKSENDFFTSWVMYRRYPYGKGKTIISLLIKESYRTVILTEFKTSYPCTKSDFYCVYQTSFTLNGRKFGAWIQDKQLGMLHRYQSDVTTLLDIAENKKPLEPLINIDF